MLALGVAGSVLAFALLREPGPEPIVFDIPENTSEVGVPLGQAGCSPVEEPDDQGGHEVTPGEEHPPFSSSPPTSGWYYPGGLEPALYYVPTDPEAPLRNMAEGDVIVWHTGLSPEQIDELKGLFVLLKSEQITGLPGDDLGLQHPIVLTAWGKLQRCDRLSGEAIAQFFEAYRGQGIL